MYRILVIWLGKLLLKLARLTGGGGSAFPGLVVEKLHQNLMSELAQALSEGIILVTGTNGKTTTAKMLRTILETDGKRIIANRAGSNMTRGILSALVDHADWRGRLSGDWGLFEVDEAYVGETARVLKPNAVVVLNLLRDQLDRYGELDRTAQLIGEGLEHTNLAVLNADDPLVAQLMTHVHGTSTAWFGATAKLRPLLPHDAALYDTAAAERSVSDEEAVTELLEVQPTDNAQTIVICHQQQPSRIELAMPGLYNAYNALAALVTALSVGVDRKIAINGLERSRAAYGRTETINIGDKSLQLLLVKNPAGFNQVIQTFLTDNQAPILFAVNDLIADGRDVSWLWDVDFEQLSDSRPIIASGFRGYDLALRLKYADIKSETELELPRALGRFLSQLKAGQTGYIVPTYTAMLTLRRLLSNKTKLERIWQ